MLNIYYRTLVASFKTYGPRSAFWQWLIAEPLFRFFTFFTLFLDRIFFPKFRKVKVINPVFIIGHPRSGTTFLHHLLTRVEEAAPFKAWHLLFPALTARVLVKPLIKYLIRTKRDVILPEEVGHKITLGQTEEEEMLFLHIYDTQFMTINQLGFDDREHPEIEHHDQQPAACRHRSMEFLNSCFQRHLYYTGKKQLIAQTHFSTHRLKTLQEFFPDAKFIFILRSPYEVLPSWFSLLHKGIEFKWGIKNTPPAILARYYRRRYRACIALYRYFHDLHGRGETDRDRVMILHYERLRTDLGQVFDEIVDFTGLKVSEALAREVSERARNQKNYQRKHQVIDIEEFGITREQIAEDFSFVFEGYGHLMKSH